MNATKVLTVEEFAAKHGSDNVAGLRKACRKDRIEGAFKFGNTWAIPADAPMPDMTPKAATRKDGRQRYNVWATKDELLTIMQLVGDSNVTNPREQAKARREARKAEAAKADNAE